MFNKTQQSKRKREEVDNENGEILKHIAVENDNVVNVAAEEIKNGDDERVEDNERLRAVREREQVFQTLYHAKKMQTRVEKQKEHNNSDLYNIKFTNRAKVCRKLYNVNNRINMRERRRLVNVKIREIKHNKHNSGRDWEKV